MSRVPVSSDEPINIIDKAQQSDMGLSTNIKVAVSNRVKSAKPKSLMPKVGAPAATAAAKCDNQQSNIYSINTRNGVQNHRTYSSTNPQSITPGKQSLVKPSN